MFGTLLLSLALKFSHALVEFYCGMVLCSYLIVVAICGDVILVYLASIYY